MYRYIIIGIIIITGILIGRITQRNWLKFLEKIEGWRNDGFRFLTLIILPSAFFIMVLSIWYKAPADGTNNSIVTPKFTQSDSKTISQETAKNVILISIDALTARDMSLHGYNLDTTPNLVRFAKQAHFFKNANSNSNFTTASVASMLTGVYPSVNRVFTGFADINPEKSLPKTLKNAGYYTAALVANGVAHPGNLGMDDEFDFLAGPLFNTWNPVAWIRAWGSFLWSQPNPLFYYALAEADRVPTSSCNGRTESYLAGYTAKQVTDASIGLMKTVPPQPLFVWTHYLPPHFPYLPPKPYIGRFLSKDNYRCLKEQGLNYVDDYGTYPPDKQQNIDQLRLRYDEAIAYVDAEVGRYLNWLEENGYFNNSIIIITSDHGESFEKGYWQHAGPFMHESLVHVPLIIRLPGQNEGSSVEERAELIDITKTIADYIGLPSPQTQGKSLLNSVDTPSKKGKGSPTYAINIQSDSRFNLRRTGTFAVYWDNFKAIWNLWAADFSIYRLDTDPNELNNLVKDFPEQRKQALELLRPRILESIPKEAVGIYRLGEPIDFSINGSSLDYIIYGWSSPEDWGCWSVGSEATLAFKVDSPITYPLNLSSKINTFSRDPQIGQSVRILVNSKIAGQLQISASEKEYSIDLPASLFNKDQNIFTLTFQIEDPASPKELGLSGDTRKLGMGVKSLTLSAVK